MNYENKLNRKVLLCLAASRVSSQLLLNHTPQLLKLAIR